MARCMHYLPTHQHCSPTLLSLVGSACHGATCHIAAEAVKMPPFLDLSLTFFHCPSLHSECVEMNSEYAVCPQNFSTLLCLRRHRFTAFHTAASPTFRRICRGPHQDKGSVGFVLMRAADSSAKSAQAPRPYRQGSYQDNLEGIRPSGLKNNTCSLIAPGVRGRWSHPGHLPLHVRHCLSSP